MSIACSTLGIGLTQDKIEQVMLRSFINGNFIELTKRKLFGKYFHVIISHTAIQYRITSG